jgi:hypothetical protein
LAVAALCGIAVAGAWSGVGAQGLTPHRAVYLLELSKANASSGLADADGVMVIAWEATCDAWTVQQRIRLNMRTTHGDTLETDTGFTSWETVEGTEYRFSVRTYRNGQLDEELKGEAQLDENGGSGEAVYSEPEGLRIALPSGSLFPTIHTVDLIAAAQRGQHTFFRIIFDGATLQGAAEVNAVISRKLEAPQSDPADPLLDREGWPMRLAYFNLGDQAEEPHYELGIVLLDNGVATELSMEYGDFTIGANLERIEALPVPDC